jgi:hypothetical protein
VKIDHADGGDLVTSDARQTITRTLYESPLARNVFEQFGGDFCNTEHCYIIAG